MKLIVIFLFIICALMICLQCSDNKIVYDVQSSFDGVWEEYFFEPGNIDPGAFVIGDTFEYYGDSGNYTPPEPILLDSVIYRNDSCFGHFSDGQLFYFATEPLKSRFYFHNDSFNLQISGGQLVEKELAGRCVIKANAIIFNINYNYYRYWERFNPGYDREAEWSDTLLFDFESETAVRLYCPMTQDSAFGTIELMAFPWYLPPFPGMMKNSGVFIKN